MTFERAAPGAPGDDAPVNAQVPDPGLGTTLRRIASALAGRAPQSPDPEYRAWLALRSPTPRELRVQRARMGDLRVKPSFAVVVRRRAGDGAAVERSRQSLAAQTWTRFHAVEAGPGEDGTAALRRARGDLVVVLESGDVLAPHALFSIAAAAEGGTDLVYADEDWQGPGGLERPYFKPGWSPEEVLSHPYVGGAAAIRRSLLDSAGSGADLRQHDLLVRLLPALRRVIHLPDMLLHRRPGASPDAREGRHLPSRDPSPPPRVAAVIPTRDRADLLAACVASLEAHPNRAELEVMLVDDHSTTEDARALLRQLAERPGTQVVSWNRDFNWSAVNDLAARLTSAEYLLFLNNDVEATHAGWLDAMVGLAERPGVGLVGAQLLYPDGALQHYGVVMGMTGFAGHLLQGCSPLEPSRFGPADVIRNCSAVTGACLLVRRDVFERLGGFDERFVLCGSDVALGLSAMAAGLRNVVTPHARLLHRESRTRGSAVPASDYRVSFEVYQPWLRAGDPYYNPNLSLRDTRARIRLAREDMLAVARRYLS